MRERCEVCENFRPDIEFEGDRNTILVSFDTRPVLLCMGHARIARNSGVTSFEGLRELYGTGRRSFVPRRGREPTTRGQRPAPKPGTTSDRRPQNVVSPSRPEQLTPLAARAVLTGDRVTGRPGTDRR